MEGVEERVSTNSMVEEMASMVSIKTSTNRMDTSTHNKEKGAPKEGALIVGRHTLWVIARHQTMEKGDKEKEKGKGGTRVVH